MKKFLLIIFILVLLPTVAYAFSFTNVFSFLNKKEAAEEKKIQDELNFSERFVADKKYKVWKEAFEKESIEIVFKNEDNFYFAEAELNYFISKRLGDMKNPPVEKMKIDLEDNIIRVKAHSLIKMFKGDVEFEAAPILKGNRVAFEVKKASFKKIYFPGFLASLILNKELEDTYAFLYSHLDIRNLKIVVTEDMLELKYSQ